jgi:hypothetical protein
LIHGLDFSFVAREVGPPRSRTNAIFALRRRGEEQEIASAKHWEATDNDDVSYFVVVVVVVVVVAIACQKMQVCLRISGQAPAQPSPKAETSCRSRCASNPHLHEPTAA